MLAIVTATLPANMVSAEKLSSRSVVIGNSTQNAVTSHVFNFAIPSYDTVGAILFEYCENTPFTRTTCVAPPGLNVSDAVLNAQSGETGFTLDAPTSNRLALSRSSSATVPGSVSYGFTNITNPSGANKPVYVRISTHASDITYPVIDEGAVAFSTAENIAVSGYVPPYLVFCVGVTVEINCSGATGNVLNFGDLSPREARSLTSQYSGSTNDPGGYTTATQSGTMTSGNNIIPAINGGSDVSRPGTGQFGLNLRANSSPANGRDPEGPGSSAPTNAVGTPNRYNFDNQIISRATTATDYKRFTATYIVNVPPSQRPGIYNTTVTYIAVAAF